MPEVPDDPRLRVFLCHASEDKEKVRELYETLSSLGVDPWLDEKKLLPGQFWRSELARALQQSHLVLVCLSKKSVSKEGTVQREIKVALDLAQEKPGGSVYLLPMRLEKCEVPSSLKDIQYVDYFEPDWLPKVLCSLAMRSISVGIPWKHLLKPIKITPLQDLPSGLAVRLEDLGELLGPSEMTLLAMAHSIECRDLYNSQHCVRVATTCVDFAQKLDLPRSDSLVLLAAAYLHDIGKIFIPNEIVFKAGILLPEEFEIMKTHTIRGEELCRSFEKLARVLPLIRSHHECWNGSGYPDGLAGDRIPLLARILQLADVFDAITSDRPYKKSPTRRDAIEAIQSGSAAGRYDPKLTAAFADFMLAGSAGPGT
jgi:putative nucleotidyltransferase with HDIG domain